MSGLNRVVALLLAASFVGGGLTGCEKKSESSGPAGSQSTATATKPAVAESAVAAWLQGDKANALNRFLETDWSAGPLFEAGSSLALTEAQFKSLSSAQREAQSQENLAKLKVLKEMAATVVAAGRAAAEKQDVALARKHFNSVRQFGEALDGPDSLAILKLVGQAAKKMADKELTALGQ